MLLLVALLADRGRRGPGARTLAQATQVGWRRRGPGARTLAQSNTGGLDEEGKACGKDSDDG